MKLVVCVAASIAALTLLADPPPAIASSARSEAGAEFVPGEVVVRFRAVAGRAAGQAALDAIGARVRQELPLPRTVLVSLAPGWSVPEAVAALEADPDVQYAEPNYVYRISAIPNDPHLSLLWALNQASDRDMDAPEAWDVTTGSRNVVVAVVDTGLAYEHPDLAANVWTNAADPPGGGDEDGNGKVDDSRGWDFVDGDKTPLDPNGHGTHVAGTIGATGHNALGVVGVNWQVSLMALRAARPDGSLELFHVVEAIAYACAKGARVVNGSFGGPGESATLLATLGLPACANTLFVFAAGNGGRDGVGDNNDAAPQYPCSYALTTIVCVAATNKTDALTSFSNFGVATVDLAAPGFEIWSTWPAPEYARADGTSMATPQVAGVAALVLARFPALTAEELRNKTLNGVDTVPALAGAVATGGRVNALGALNVPALPPLLPPPPPPPAPLPATVSAPRDTALPNTRLISGPARTTAARTARFRFTATEAGSRFQCRLDRGRWTACGSPKSYRGLPRGFHTFRVRAIDVAGNADATPARRVWRIR